jgi:hypothetical protein
MKQLLLVLVLFLSFPAWQYAQGKVTYLEPESVQSLMKLYVEQNKARMTVEGWRIQVLATTDRQRMQYSKQRFQTLYPSIPVDWVHSNPYYKLQAGAFENKKDAMRILYTIKRDYPSAYTVLDKNIRPVELLH